MQYQNILLIDDDVEDQEIFNGALKIVSDQLNCTALSDAKDALVKLDSRQLIPDVIFLDLNMPVMNGLEFLERIKNIDHLSDIHVIIFSTTSNPTTIAAAKDMGAIGFITKPHRFDDLVNILKPLINL